MNNVFKFLLLAFGLMVTCILILYFSRVLKTGMDTSMTATEKLDKFNKELTESDYMMFDGEEVQGSSVVNTIKKELGNYSASESANMYVRVITATNDTTHRNGGAISDIQNFSSVLYIKPTAMFLGSVVRDANEVIIGLIFQQR